MHIRMGHRHFHLLLSLLLLLCCDGCLSSEAIRPDELPHYAKSNVVVTLKDGRAVRFDSGNHTVDTTDSVKVLRGTGDEFTDATRREFRQFSGSIPLSDITAVEVRKKTITFYGLAVVGVISAATIIAFYIIGHNGGFKQ